MNAALPAISTGLAPVWRSDAKILILGSLPGVASLKAAQYYAHPRNQCWPILGRLFGINPQLDYPAKLMAAQMQGIAFWDLVKSASRQGSLDSAIVSASMTQNRLIDLLVALPKLKHIVLNGQKAAQLFQQQMKEDLPLKQWLLQAQKNNGLVWHALPSTSPAHAAMSFEQKVECWQQALCAETSANSLLAHPSGGQC